MHLSLWVINCSCHCNLLGRLIRIICQSWGVLILLKFWQFSSELTKTWSSCATEHRVWIGNCNFKVWKSTEHKLHNIWHSVKFQQNKHTPDAILSASFNSTVLVKNTSLRMIDVSVSFCMEPLLLNIFLFSWIQGLICEDINTGW